MKRVVMKRAVHAALAALLCAILLPAHAENLRIANPNQTDFNAFANDVTAAFDYRTMQPGVTGLVGFNVSAFGGGIHIHNRDAYKRLTGHDDGSIVLGGVQVNKGLPGGLGVGAFIAGVADNSMTLYGAQVRYALLQGSMLLPSLVVSGSYTGAAGIEDFDYHSWSTDVTLAKSLPFITPYVGVGYVWGHLSPRNGISLQAANADRAKGFVGVRFSLLPLLHLGVEYERVGSTNGLGVRVGVSL